MRIVSSININTDQVSLEWEYPKDEGKESSKWKNISQTLGNQRKENVDWSNHSEIEEDLDD